VVQKFGREFEHCTGIHPFILALGISMRDTVIFCFRYVVLSLSEGVAAWRSCCLVVQFHIWYVRMLFHFMLHVILKKVHTLL